jgi:hypothetical protein
MKGKLFMMVLWPGFLGAAVLEMLVFALIDPSDLHLPLLVNAKMPISVYTLMFFVFWTGTTVASVLTAILADKSGGFTGRPKD